MNKVTNKKLFRKAVYNRRLLKLANGITQPTVAKHFQLDVLVDLVNYDYYSNKDFTPELNTDYVKQGKAPSCGFAGCAIGHLPVVFPKDFKYIADEEFKSEISVALKSNDVPEDSCENFDAAEQYFGLTEDEAEYLFQPYYYRPGHRGPRSVATRIRQFVEKGIPQKYKRYNVY